MKLNRLSMISVGIVSASVFGLAGCATADVHPKLAVYGRISLPPEAGVIGLTVTRPGPEFALQLPEAKSSGARSAAAAGARGVASDPYAAFLFPAGYVMGGIMGGIFGVSERHLKASTQSIEAAAEELHFDERLAQTITEHVNAGQGGPIRALADNVPMERPMVEGSFRRGISGRLAWAKPSRAPHPLAGTEVDTVIGIRVGFQGFQSRPNPHVSSTGDVTSFNPPLALMLMADVTVVRVSDWVELGGLTICYESVPLKFTEWAADSAQPLRREMQTALQEICRQIPLQVTR